MTEFQFICNACGQIFTTRDKNMPICRFCRQMDRNPANYGRPTPTPLQAAKWKKSKRAVRLLQKDLKTNDT